MDFLNSEIKGNKKSTDEKLNDSDEEKLVDSVPPELAFWFEILWPGKQHICIYFLMRW